MCTLLPAVLGALVGFFVALILGVVVAGGAFQIARPGVEISHGDLRGVDPSQSARKLAQSISEGMNCAALAAVVTMPLGAFWFVRRSRRPRAERPAA